MPQLDPSPWFFILFITWSAFLLFSPTKIAKHYFLNDPATKSAKNTSNSWTWPWL
uniref:ATP synthase complex subunit 8 n=1 Tax=Dendrobates leucomelas TaxID=85590 RepID=A0A343J4K5_9NEOB|nr:ATP synthase F0 subunit 8 [Dendrobates leucomelas]